MLTTRLHLVRYGVLVIKIVTRNLGGKVATFPDGLTFKCEGWYLNFSACFMKKISIIEQKNIKF